MRLFHWTKDHKVVYTSHVEQVQNNLFGMGWALYYNIVVQSANHDISVKPYGHVFLGRALSKQLHLQVV